ncbi:MAG: hypothetical protein ACMG50_00720 [Thermomonas sp.]
MSRITNSKSTSANARRKRVIKVAPMTRAVRMALAASLAALALGASGGAFAANCSAPATVMTPCKATSIDAAPVADLTLVHAAAPLAGHGAFIMPLAINQSSAGDVVIDNAVPITEVNPYGATAIYGYSSGGTVDITNQPTGTLQAISAYGNATGIEGYAFGDVGIENAGEIYVRSEFGSAIGVYGYSISGDVSIDNSATINAVSYYGLADGIFASGANVDVSNSGRIAAFSAYGNWAAGIEAQATDLVTVDNSANIYATAYYGQAFGIYATGDLVEVGNSGNIEVQGYYATGIEAQGESNVTIINDGSINAGRTTYSALAWGIHAAANGEGAAIVIDNSGTIDAAGIYGATGIEAVSSGLGGTVSVTNTGDIAVTQNLRLTSYGGTGILASADGDSTVFNDGGNVLVNSKGPAVGLVSTSFAGTASVVNTGNVDVSSTLNSSANASIGAIGIVAFSGNGDAFVGNDGYVYAHGVRSGTGIDAGAGAAGNVTVTNSGDIVALTNIASGARANGIKVAAGGGAIEVENSGSIYASGAVLAFGIYSSSAVGDTHIANTEGGDIEFYSYIGRGFGMFAFAEQGDVSIDNAGDIHGYAWLQAYGARERALYGDATIDNAGNISVESGSNKAFGLLVSATYEGTAGITNSGDIEVFSRTGSYGMRASGHAGVDMSNSGTIYAVSSKGVALGMMGQATTGDITITNTAGSIQALAATAAFGIYANATGGNVTVSNDSEIYARGTSSSATGIKALAGGDVDITNSAYIYAASNGNAIGLYGYSIAGDVSINNSGDITAVSNLRLADGIFASGAQVNATNSGDITAVSVKGNWAAGIEAQSIDLTSVANSGSIYAYTGAAGAHAYGIYTTGDVVQIVNTGSIEAQGYYATGIEAQGGNVVSITNVGDIVAGSAYYSAVATGINASSNTVDGVITVTNSGSIEANGYFGGTGIAATSIGAGGSASITNNGSIYASQTSSNGYGAYGMFASADGDASVHNNLTGTINVYTPGVAGGALALSFAGNTNATNAGDINVYGYQGADGIVSFAQNGTAYAGNSGSIEVGTGYTGHGIDVGGLQGATAVNSGAIAVDAWYGFGINANSGNGDVSVDNTGSIDVAYTGPFSSNNAFGVLATSVQGDISVVNSGDISTDITRQSVGVFASSTHGDVDAINSGTISAYSVSSTAVGLFTRATDGLSSVDNSGAISAESHNGSAFGVLARGAYVDVSSSGDVTASGKAGATGIAALSYYGTTVTTTSGAISAYAIGRATGINAQSQGGDVTVANASSIDANGMMLGATGINSYAYGNATVSNAGDIYAGSVHGSASGIFGYSVLGNTAVSNSGTIEAIGYSGAYGIAALSYLGDVSVTNSGHVTATSPNTAVGILASAYGDVTINNSGTILAIADGDSTNVAAVQMASAYGQSTLNNAHTGSISVQGSEGYAFAVVGSDAVDTINNSGLITGAVTLYGGNDVFNNRNGGVWDVGTTYSTDFGDGDDTINNLAGGIIRLDSGAIYLGSRVVGNAFNNTGTIKVNGDSLIDMGSGVVSLVPSLNPLPLVNNGLIDMTDGAADDSLTIVGDLGGHGSLNIDVNVPDGLADTLYVNGSMATGAVQTVNATFSPSLLAAVQSQASVDFAFVTGNSTAGSFVGGQVVGFDASNFLQLGVVVSSKINTANTAADVFSIGVDALGLNDTGSLAASIASGAAGMLNAQVGTFKQRMGVNPYGDAGKVMSAFFRTYTSQGDVNPTHAMTNFGQGGNFDYDQSVWGREVGVNANLYGNFHAGLVLGTADGRQRLTGAGVGQNRMDGMTWGAYATWFAPQGFYVDVSGRWMAVDVRSISSAGTSQTRAHTGAWNLEAGYEWKLGGLSIVPQLQYTRTKVDEVATIRGSLTTFDVHGGTSSRGRLGVEVSRPFQTSGGMTVTPYGSLNAIREFDGDMNYTVANVFNGATGTKGTSTMAELGLGVQKGDWAVTAGANWIDGGAQKSVVGGQLIVRFAW